MHRLLRLLLVPVIVLGLLAQDATVKTDANQQTGRLRKRITQMVNLEYLLFLPPGVKDDPGKPWPLILFLHGAGERGTNVWLVAKHGPPKLVREKKDFPFIVVSPQCAEGETWSNEALLALLDTIIAKYPVDRSRVYLTGLSMGGYGTWSLGIEHPERFAAIVPICGGGDTIKILLPPPAREADLKSLGVWAFHGGKDTVVKPIETERMVQALKQRGVREVKHTVYPDAGHDSWTEAYNDPALYEWLLSHRRTPKGMEK